MRKLFSTLMVIAALISGIGAYATNSSSLQTTLYRSSDNQAWPATGAGTAALNQADDNYSALPLNAGSYTCDNLDIGCSYQKVGTQYQFVSRGLNSLN